MTFLSILTVINRALTHPVGLIIGPLLGISLKFLIPEDLATLKPLQRMYYSFCSVAVVPAIFASMALSVTKIMFAPKKLYHLGKMIKIFFGVSLVFSVLSFMVDYFFSFGKTMIQSTQIQDMVVRNFQVQNGAFDTVLNKNFVSGFAEFLINSIPVNIVQGLSTGMITQVIFSALLLGFAIYAMQAVEREKLISLIEIVNRPFDIMIEWTYVFLPVGLFLNTAVGMESISDWGIFYTILRIILACIGVFVVGAVAALWWSARRLQVSLLQLAGSLRQSLILAFTVSEFAPIALVSQAMRPYHLLNADYFRFCLPVGLSLFGFAEMFYYNLIALTVMDIYQIKFGFLMYIVLGLSTFFAVLPRDSMDQTVPGMFSAMKTPAALPLMIFPAVDWIVDPFRNVMNFCVNCACAVAVATEKSGGEKTDLPATLVHPPAHTQR